jgi:hypothetical protein
MPTIGQMAHFADQGGKGMSLGTALSEGYVIAACAQRCDLYAALRRLGLDGSLYIHHG